MTPSFLQNFIKYWGCFPDLRKTFINAVSAIFTSHHPESKPPQWNSQIHCGGSFLIETTIGAADYPTPLWIITTIS